MDTPSKVLLVVFFTLVVIATVWKYDTFILKRDYVVYDYVSCDLALGSCFAYECAEDDEECDDTPYQKIVKNASAIPLCTNYIEDACPELTCGANEEGCEIISCSDETLEDGEYCVDEMPLEEEELLEEEPAPTEEDASEEEAAPEEETAEEEPL